MKLNKFEEKMIRNYRLQNAENWRGLIQTACEHANRDEYPQRWARTLHGQIAQMRKLLAAGADFDTHEDKFGWDE